MIDVGRADQREVLLVGDRKEDPPVGQLEEIGIVVLEQPPHDNMRPAYQSHRMIGLGIGALQ